MSSLAVKYRPTTWKDVYGQDSVKRILQGQLNTGDIKNAYIFSGLSGSGKAQPLYEQVLTPAGYTCMKDIQVGDEVIDGRGKVTTVLGVFPQGSRDCYRILFTDRTYIDVADNHLNSVWYVKNKCRHNQIITTEQLIRQLATPDFKRGRKMHIDLPVIDCWEDNNVDINPYLLGVLLGDGGLSSGTLRISNSEDDIIQKVSTILDKEYAMHLKHIRNYDYSISYTTTWKYKFEYNNQIFFSCDSIKAYLHAQGYPRFDSETILRMCIHPEKSHTIKKYPELRGKLNLVETNEQNSYDRPNILKQQLATYGLLTRSDKKHIPLNYLMSSVQTRLELLRGLMDTDGHKRGRNFGTSAPELARDFEFLVRSLGIKCTVSIKIPKFRGKEYKKHFMFYLKPSNNMKIVSSEKMLANLSPAQREPDRTIKSITYIGKEECQCIYVDSPEHTYITSNFTVTHNTTCARLFANEVNNYQGFPIEMDMASNNGVDNVRNIINMANERSINSKYRIFLLDEAHMTTTQGWNAFLKCIEEPPKYTIFIFCTTDPQKIPDTIKNRCMRLNFNRIPTNLIEERLKYICEQEHITGEVDKVCAYISRVSNGGMRTAISMLETCINEDNTVAEKTCAESLGLFSYEIYFNLINSIVDKNIEKILGTTDELSDSGIDFRVFIDGFISFVLDLNKYIINNDIKATRIPSYLEDKVKYAVGFEGNNKILLDIVESLLEVKNVIKQDTDLSSTVQVMLISISRKI